MKDNWEERISCALTCSRCNTTLDPKDSRILSVYDNKVICMPCKSEEEQRPDYKEVSSRMIGHCMLETELLYGDPQDYCYHHFYPFVCT